MALHVKTAAQPFGGQLCVGVFETTATDREGAQDMTFHMLCSEEAVLCTISEDDHPDTWAREVAHKLVAKAFGVKRYRVGDVRLVSTLTDPRTFPHRIHHIFTRNQPPMPKAKAIDADDDSQANEDAEAAGEDDEEAAGQKIHTADILYGYKVVKFGRIDIPRPEEEEELLGADGEENEDDEDEDARPSKKRKHNKQDSEDEQDDDDEEDYEVPEPSGSSSSSSDDEDGEQR
jgi:hypothetical protein